MMVNSSVIAEADRAMFEAIKANLKPGSQWSRSISISMIRFLLLKLSK